MNWSALYNLFQIDDVILSYLEKMEFMTKSNAQYVFEMIPLPAALVILLRLSTKDKTQLLHKAGRLWQIGIQ